MHTVERKMSLSPHKCQKIVSDAISDSCKDCLLPFLPYIIIYCVHILLHAL